MELNAESSNLREELARHEDRDQGTQKTDAPAQEAEADDHGDESNADSAQEFGDERGFECDAYRSQGERVLAVGDSSDLVGAVRDGTKCAKLWCVLENFKLARLKARPALLVLRRYLSRFADPARW